MVNIYFYPKIDPEKSASPNHYILHLESALAKSFNVVNKKRNEKGVLDLFRYFFRADLFLYNWIEDLVIYRFGKLQIISFVFFLFTTKLLRKKHAWVLHNKYTHDRRNNAWTNFMFDLMIRHSDLILTHSTGGIDLVNEIHPKYVSKVKYYVHPTLDLFKLQNDKKKKYDFLIWGTLYPYKGVLDFLQFLKETKKLQEARILIIGRCPDRDYTRELYKYLSENIELKEGFYELDDIAQIAAESRFILFTHKSRSVLSSGALMDSIRMGSTIVGPNYGAFKDLSSYSFMETYDHFDEINTIRNRHRENDQVDLQELENFCKEHSWDTFATKLEMELTLL